MLDRGKPACFSRSLLTLLALIVLALGGVVYSSTSFAATLELTNLHPHLRAVLLNGGGQPASNYYSHFLHIKRMLEVLRRAGVPPADITIFNADGSRPQADFAIREPQPEADFWLLEGTRLEQPLQPQIRFE